MLSEKEIDELSKEIERRINSFTAEELDHAQAHIKQVVDSYLMVKITNSVYDESNFDYLY